MVNFDFYRNAYLGDTIPEKNFPGMAAQAGSILERFKTIYRVESAGEESENMAVCAMAESLYAASRRRGGIRSASLGDVSVTYSDSGEKLMPELFHRASIYLDIYRGVGA